MAEGPPRRRLRCRVLGELGPRGWAALWAGVPPGSLALVGEGTGADVVWDCFGPVEAVARALGTRPTPSWLHTSAAGLDRLRDVLGSRPGLVVTHGAGISAVPIAEFVVACLLAHAKRLAAFAAQQRAQRWHSPDLLELTDLRVVLLGVGAIGRAVGERLAPFGCVIVGVRRGPGPAAPSPLTQVLGPDRLEEACAGADALVIAAPLTAETRGMVGRRVLAALAPGAVLVNVARGAILDEAALLEGLAQGRPAAAYLDALTEEPLPPASPLWSAPGVLVTCHSSWSSPRFDRRCGELFADQVRRRLSRRPLRNVADLAVGY